MSDGRVSIDIDVKYAAAIDAFLKLSQKIGSAGKELDNIGAKAKENLRFLKQLENAFQTPGEKYNAESQRLLQLRMQGKVSREDYTKFQSGIYKRYTESDPTFIAQKKAADELAASVKKAEQELKRYAERTKEINATPMEKYAAAVNRAKEALKAGELSQADYNREVARASKELQEASDSSGEAFGDQAIGMLSRYLAGIVSVTTAVSALQGVYDDLTKAREKAFDDAQTQLEANLVATSAGATPEEKSKMLEQFHRLRTMPSAGGYSAEQTAGGYSKAYQANFDAKSIEELFLAAMQVKGNLEDLATMAETARVQFGKEGLTHTEAINAALVVSKITQASPEDISKFYGQSFSQLGQGFKYSEAIGLQAAMQTAFGKGSIGADRTRAFINVASKDDELRQILDSGDSEKLIDEIVRMGPEEWKDRLGMDQESYAAKLAMQKQEVMDIYKKATEESQKEIDAIRDGAKDTYVRREARAIMAVPGISGQVKAREAKEKSEQAGIEALGSSQSDYERLTAALNTAHTSTADPIFIRLLSKMARGAARSSDVTMGGQTYPSLVMRDVQDIYQETISSAEKDGFVSKDEADSIMRIKRALHDDVYGVIYKNKTENELISEYNRYAEMGKKPGVEGRIYTEKSEYIESLIKQQTAAANAVKDAVINADGRTKSAIEASKANRRD